MVSYFRSCTANGINARARISAGSMDRLFTRCCRTACFAYLLVAACIAEALNLFTNVHPKLCFSLQGDTLNAFRTHGHAVTRNLLSRSMYDDVAGKLWQIANEKHGMEGATQHLHGMGRLRRASQFDRVIDPHAQHSSITDLALSPLLLGTAAAFLGVAQVRLFGDALFWKRRGHGPTAWHADLWTAPLPTDRFITVWLPLSCIAGPEDAPLYFQSGTHRHPSVTIQCVNQEGTGDVGPPGHAGTHHAPLEVGDATWHHGWTTHGSPGLSGCGAEGPGRLAYTASYYCDNDGGLTPLDAEL